MSPTARDLMRETAFVIPLRMSVRAAAGLLEAAEVGVAPVVDYRGRCVGVFTTADYRRWLARSGPDAKDLSGRHTVVVAKSRNEVRYHMSRFSVATPETGVQELLHCLNEGEDPFLVVVDRQQRPRGIVCALDVLVAEANWTHAGSGLLPATGRTESLAVV